MTDRYGRRFLEKHVTDHDHIAAGDIIPMDRRCACLSDAFAEEGGIEYSSSGEYGADRQRDRNGHPVCSQEADR